MLLTLKKKQKNGREFMRVKHQIEANKSWYVFSFLAEAMKRPQCVSMSVPRNSSQTVENGRRRGIADEYRSFAWCGWLQEKWLDSKAATRDYFSSDHLIWCYSTVWKHQKEKIPFWKEFCRRLEKNQGKMNEVIHSLKLINDFNLQNLCLYSIYKYSVMQL